MGATSASPDRCRIRPAEGKCHCYLHKHCSCRHKAGGINHSDSIAAAGDPVGTGLVASLARPGGNVTGLSIQQTDLAGKRLEILRDLLPNLRALAILANAGSPNAVLEMDEADAAARRLRLTVIRSEVRKTEDFAPALDALKRWRGSASL